MITRRGLFGALAAAAASRLPRVREWLDERRMESALTKYWQSSSVRWQPVEGQTYKIALFTAGPPRFVHQTDYTVVLESDPSPTTARIYFSDFGGA